MGKSFKENPWKYKKDRNFQKKQKQKEKNFNPELVEKNLVDFSETYDRLSDENNKTW